MQSHYNTPQRIAITVAPTISAATPYSEDACGPTHTLAGLIQCLAFIVSAVMQPCLAASDSPRLTRYGMEQGLPQMFVTQIAQDPKGFLWVATQDGLARFDGRTFAVHRKRPGDSTSIVGSHAHRLVVGTDSNLYVATGGGNAVLNMHDGAWKSFPNIPFPKPLYQDRLTQVHSPTVNVTYHDREGRTWVASTLQGLSVTDPATGSTFRFDTRSPAGRRLASDDVWALCEDNRGRMWVGTNGGGLAIIDNMQVVATLRHATSNPTSLSSDVVRHLFEDDAGRMWIGTFGGGLCQYDPYAHILPHLEPARYHATVSSSDVRAIAQFTDGQILVGTRTGILICDTNLHSSRVLVSWHHDYTRVGAARALFVDRTGTVWVGTERNGVGFLAPGSSRVTWLRGRAWTSRPNTNTVSFIGGLDSSTVVIGADGGIAIANIASKMPAWHDVPRTQGLPYDRISVSAITPISSTKVLVGTEFGLFKGPLGGPYTLVANHDSNAIRPNIDIVRSIVVDDRTAIVATWGGGIRFINLDSFSERVVDTRHGLPNQTIYAAYPIARDIVAFSSNAGIGLLNRRTNTMMRQLTPHHGAQSYEFNSWSHLLHDNGTLYLGGVNGVNLLRYPQLLCPPPPRLHLAYDTSAQGLISIRVGAIALSNTDSVQFRYMVDGRDTAWSFASGPELLLTSLPVGTHALRIQARYHGGSFSQPLLTTITIRPPLWLSWWFMSLVALGGSAAVWGASAAVSKRRAAQRYHADRLLQAERLRIARDLHDEVGTGLAKIVMLAESDHLLRSPTVRTTIADTARDVVERVRSIVWVMKASRTQLSHTVGYACDGIADALADHSITLLADINVEHDHTLNVSQMRNMVLSMKEAAANIIRHSKATSVRMKVVTTPHSVTIEISDDGVGFDTTTQGNGSGLSNLAERMQEVGGTLEITSGSANGTRLTFMIPIA